MPHAKYSPSSSHRWLNCPGCVALAQTVPEPPPKQYTIEGTAAHWLAQQKLTPTDGDLLKIFATGRYFLFERTELDRGGFDYEPMAVSDVKPTAGPIVQITDDMLAAVQKHLDYVDHCLTSGELYPAGGDLFVEHAVEVAEDCGGTADIIIDVPFRTLHVVDYKNGQGLVEVFENTQLELYGIGALEKFGDMYDQVFLTIVQPNAEHRDGPIRTWRLTPAELLERAVKFDEARLRCEAEPTTYIDGEWCHWCEGIGICPRMHDRTIEVAKADFGGCDVPAIVALEKDEPAIVAVEVDKIKTILDAEERIGDLIKQAKNYAIDLIQSGVEIPGYAVKPSLGNRRWKTDADGEQDIAGLVNFLKRKKHKLDEYKPRKIIGPAPMEKLIGDKKRVAAFCTRDDRGFSLAKVKTNAPALSSALNDFDDVEVEEKKDNE